MNIKDSFRSYKKKMGLLIFPAANLFFMHGYFRASHLLEWTFLYSTFANICSVVFDVSTLVVMALVISRGKFKPAVAITQAITWAWSLVNVFYAKFFFQYMPVSAILQVQGLGDGFVVDSILSAIDWSIAFYVVSLAGFLLLYKKTTGHIITAKRTRYAFVIPLLALAATLLFYSAYHFAQSRYRGNWEMYNARILELLYDVKRGGTPNLAHFQAGAIRSLVFEVIDELTPKTLTLEQREEISRYYSGCNVVRTTHHQTNPNIKNVILILLESFLSAPIDSKIEGQEVTPFLNSLVKDSSVYYNGNMLSDITCGESGDGQFICLNGLLPLRRKMTVGAIKNHTLKALPKVLNEQMGIHDALIVVPTRPNMWQQADVNPVYGISTMFSLNDIVTGDGNRINDSDVFDFAAKQAVSASRPFFMLVLSISTHGPYTKYYGGDVFSRSTDLPEEYRNYLNTCHYTDQELCHFIEQLKATGVYDESLIVITADHHAHLNMLQMEGKITRHIPLFVINGIIDQEESWKGEFRQLDVYTTILDVLGIDAEWKGLGATILSPDYQSSVNEDTHRISEMIIEGDYFADTTSLIP